VLRAFKATFIKQLETKAYILLLWWGEMAPLSEKSLDLDNSSPVPRALMYVASLRTFSPSSSLSSSSSTTTTMVKGTTDERS
jgi:hypothetical protein